MNTEEHLYEEIKLLRIRIKEIESENQILRGELQDAREQITQLFKQRGGTLRIPIEGTIPSGNDRRDNGVST